MGVRPTQFTEKTAKTCHGLGPPSVNKYLRQSERFFPITQKDMGVRPTQFTEKTAKTCHGLGPPSVNKYLRQSERSFTALNRQIGMGRIVQPEGTKGSLKLIQHVINKSPYLLNNPINDFIGHKEENSIEWLSPREDDDYSEYRDQTFLDVLGINLAKEKLKHFWPPRGPQWDGLGRRNDRAYFLVEAKAHVSELMSSSQAKSISSKSLIKRSLNETRAYLNLNPDYDLTKGLYQYCNRLAHLYFLRILNDIPAYLVFVYFVNDHTHIQTTGDEWNGALQLIHSLLGTNRHKLSKYIIDVFLDVQEIA